MILLSLVLVLLSLGLLIGGLAGASLALVWASIVASLAAGGCLALAVLRRPRAEVDAVPEIESAAVPGSTGKQAIAETTEVVEDPVDEAGSESYPDPPDEPAEEDVSAPTALKVVDLDAEVVVVDGRPRYHLADCPHLEGREGIPLPIAEARESGFTPCSLCKPDATLVATAAKAGPDGTHSPPDAAPEPDPPGTDAPDDGPQAGTPAAKAAAETAPAEAAAGAAAATAPPEVGEHRSG